MDVDLGRERQKLIEALVKKAEELYQARDDERAAATYERAARLLEQHAEDAPSRKLEVARKKRALKLLEYARALRAGQVPKEAPKTDAPDGDDDDPPRPSPQGSTSARAPKAAKPQTEDKDKTELSQAVSALVHHSNVTWDKIGGLEETKREIKYALGISLATKPPGVELQTWRNMLFYGPPGTGKTLLAAATSNALKTSERGSAVFFNVKVSSIMSKYFGETTKIVSELYGTARDCSPAVVFLDEFESLCGARDEGDSGTERRILSTILSELDGLAEKGRSDVFVLTIAATNRPWDLDPAVLSRFDKKILIPLPDEATRRAILEILIAKRGFQATCGIEPLVAMTQGLSGREIERLAKEVTNHMVAELNAEIPSLVDKGLDEVRRFAIKVRPLTLDDFERARRHVNPVTTPEEMRRYAEWKESTEV